jgi:hypothetical protein
MKDTYTYTARSVEEPEKVVTFTLHDDRLAVDVASPVEQIARTLTEIMPDAHTTAEERAQDDQMGVWLKPLAISLFERGAGELRINDVNARLRGNQLSLKSWVRLLGLRFIPITLMKGQIDNPAAAAAFVDEVEARKEELARGLQVFKFFNYWATWVGAAASLAAIFALWRRRFAASTEPATA